MLRSVLFVRKIWESPCISFPLGNEQQIAQPVFSGPRVTKWGLHNLYFDWALSSRATDNVGCIALTTTSRRGRTFVARNVGFARFGTHVSTKVIREYQPNFLGTTYPRPGTFQCACGTNMGGKTGSHVLPRYSREYQLDKKSGTDVFPWYHVCTNWY